MIKTPEDFECLTVQQNARQRIWLIRLVMWIVTIEEYWYKYM